MWFRRIGIDYWAPLRAVGPRTDQNNESELGTGNWELGGLRGGRDLTGGEWECRCFVKAVQVGNNATADGSSPVGLGQGGGG